MADYCKRVDGVLIPACYGTAVYGIHRCTCEKPTKKTEIERLEKRITKLEEEIKLLKPSQKDL